MEATPFAARRKRQHRSCVRYVGRVTLKDLPAGGGPDVSYTYDNLGRLKSASQTGMSLSFAYDALSRNLTQTGPQGVVCSEWDLAGRRTKLIYPTTSCTDPNAFFVTYSWLTTGEIRHIYEKGVTTGLQHLAGFGSDQLGNRERIERGNGTTTFYEYDPVSRLSQLDADFPSAASDQTTTFGYNPASQITSLTRSNDGWAWTGHGSGTTSYTANGLNQYSQVDGVNATYDAFHQVYKQQQGFSGGGRTSPDMSPEEVMDAYDEWQQSRKKSKPKC